MYYMEHLLSLLAGEQARRLEIQAGRPPVIVSEKAQRPLQGPPATEEDVLRLLHSVAGSREMRTLRENGAVHFIHTMSGRAPFVIQARMEAGQVRFEVS